MKLLTFTTTTQDTPKLGIKTESGVLDLTEAVRSTGYPNIPATLPEVLHGGAEAQAALDTIVAATHAETDAPWLLEEKSLTFGPCVTHPEKILCVGLNYRRHAHESGLAIPEHPVLFSKFNNALAAHGEAIPLPENAVKYDYEVELGVVIGRTARYVDVSDALDHVFGYCVINDLSVRDLQTRTSQWLLGKTLDKFMPLGPYLVTADEVANPQHLALRCWVNGDLRQDSNTSDMVFTVAEIISYASQYMTLKPGDVISTGTPEGVVLGRPAKDWLVPGDMVSVEVEGLGRLTNTLIKETP